MSCGISPHNTVITCTPDFSSSDSDIPDWVAIHPN